EHLHVTLDMVSDAPAGDITVDGRRALADSIRQALAGALAYRGRAGSALAYRSGCVVDVSPAAPLVELRQRLRRAIHAVRGPDSTGFRVSKPHISLGYATGSADSDLYQSRLRQVDPNGAPLRLAEVRLVEVGVDQASSRLWWNTVESVALS